LIASILWVLAYQRCGVAAEFDCLYSEVFLTRNAWEKRKLNYFLHVNEIKNKSEIYSKKDVLSVSGEFGIVNQIELQGRSFAGSSVKNYGVVELGDVVYTKSPLKKNPFGIVKVNRNKAGIVSTLYAIYKPQTTLYSPIIDYYFQSDCRVNNYLKPLVNKGAKNDMKVKNVDVLKGNVTIPSEIDEQRTIVGLLNKLDKLIAATQDKIDALEQAKKALLQRLFDQSWRFKGYSDPWEKRKLGEVATITMGQSPDSKNYTLNPQDHILVQGNADIKNGWVEPRVWTTQITKIAKKGSVLLSVRAPVGEVSKTAFDVVLGRGVASVGQTDFLYQYLITLKISGFWLRYSTGSTFDSINSSDIKEAIIFLPKKNEQDRIAKTLNCIDNLIAATQSRLSSLELLKKYLLQDLFI
jgi:type I restriction enzyme, S subunit